MASDTQPRVTSDTQPTPPATPEGPAFKSTDSGATWVSINTGLSGGTVWTLRADTNLPGTIYAGTDRGVFKTTDGGDHWIQSTGLTTLFTIDKLAVDAVSPSTVYAGGSSFGALFKSDDAGLNWKTINSRLESIQINHLKIDPVNHTTLYANDDFSLFKSTKGGKKWVPVLSYPPAGDNVFSSEFVIDPFQPSTLYVTGNGHVYRTTDGGARWIDLTDRVARASGATSFIELRIDPINQSVAYISGVENGSIVKTTDGGDTWERATDLNSLRMWHLVGYSAAPSVLYSSDSFNLFKSTDRGNTWSASVLPGLETAFALDAENSSILYCGTFVGRPLADPWIRGFSIIGKKLFVNGESFDEGAVILLDGQEQPTTNDPEQPGRILVGKKAGKKVTNHPDTKIQIRNANGKFSQEVTIWPPID